MCECVIDDATAADVRWVIANMRPEHVQEAFDQSGLSPDLAVLLSVRDSIRVFAGRAGGETLFLCGAGRKSVLSDVGSVWMFATEAIDRHPIPAAEALRELFGRAHGLIGARVLEQRIPAWYAKGVKWLLWLGWEAKGTSVVNGVPHVRLVHEEKSA